MVSQRLYFGGSKKAIVSAHKAMVGVSLSLLASASAAHAQSNPSWDSLGSSVDFMSDSFLMASTTEAPAAKSYLKDLGVDPERLKSLMAVTKIENLPALPDIHKPAVDPSTIVVPASEVATMPSVGTPVSTPVTIEARPVMTRQVVSTTNSVAQPATIVESTTLPTMQRIMPTTDTTIGRGTFGNTLPPSRKQNSIGFTPTDISFVLGGGLTVLPDYHGSDEYVVGPKILFDVSYRDRLFLSSTHGLGFVPFKNDNIYTDLHFKYWPGRTDAGDLEGMEEIDPSIAVGATVGLRTSLVDIDATADWGLAGDNTGVETTISVSRWYDMSSRVSARPRGYVKIADNTYNDIVYGVSDTLLSPEATAVNAALAAKGSTKTIEAYDPGAGLNEVGASLDLEYAFNPNFSVLGSASVSALLNEAANSPIVNDLGDPYQASLSLMGVYRF